MAAQVVRKGIEGALSLAGFFRCLCGKLHTHSCISPQTKCSCGLNLYMQHAKNL